MLMMSVFAWLACNWKESVSQPKELLSKGPRHSCTSSTSLQNRWVLNRPRSHSQAGFFAMLIRARLVMAALRAFGAWSQSCPVGAGT